MTAHALPLLSPQRPFRASAAVLAWKHQQLDSAVQINCAKSSESAWEGGKQLVLLTEKPKFPIFFIKMWVELARARA